MVAVFRRWHRLIGLSLVVCGVCGAALAWLRAGVPPDPRLLDSGDAVRDAVVRAFDQRVFAATDRQPPFGRTVRIAFTPSGHPVPAPMRQLVEEIGQLTQGRVTTGDSGIGEIAVVMGKSEDGLCQVRREVWMGAAVRGVIVVEAEAEAEVGGEPAQRCFADKLLAMLGLPRADGGAAAGLSPRERVLLRLLFSPEIAPGMRRGEVLSAVRRQVEAMPAETLCPQSGGFC